MREREIKECRDILWDVVSYSGDGTMYSYQDFPKQFRRELDELEETLSLVSMLDSVMVYGPCYDKDDHENSIKKILEDSYIQDYRNIIPDDEIVAWIIEQGKERDTAELGWAEGGDGGTYRTYKFVDEDNYEVRDVVKDFTERCKCFRNKIAEYKESEV